MYSDALLQIHTTSLPLFILLFKPVVFAVVCMSRLFLSVNAMSATRKIQFNADGIMTTLNSNLVFFQEIKFSF